MGRRSLRLPLRPVTVAAVMLAAGAGAADAAAVVTAGDGPRPDAREAVGEALRAATAAGDARMAGARTGRDARMAGARTGRDARMAGTRTGGDARMAGARTGRDARMAGARTGGDARMRGAWTAGAGALPGAWTAAVVPPPAPAGAPAVDWRLAGAGRDPLSLDLVAFGSSCLGGALAATVEESARRIAVTVASTSTADFCTADYGAHPLTVRLRAPVRGRAIVGPRRLWRNPVGAPGRRNVRVPRATNLSRRDAADVVRGRGLRVRVVPVARLPRLSRVIGQRPASGRSVPRGTTVSLFVSR